MILDRRAGLIAGNQGSVIANIDGEVHELFYIKSFEAKIAKNKEVVPTLNNANGVWIVTGTEGTGTMSIYEHTSMFIELMEKFQDTGIDVFFDLTITNKDRTSELGEQVITLFDVNLDEVMLGQLDVENGTALVQDIPFTFTKFKLIKPFDPYQ